MKNLKMTRTNIINKMKLTNKISLNKTYNFSVILPKGLTDKPRTRHSKEVK